MEVQQDHIEEEGLGTFEDPVIVTRDNPQFEGLFPWVSGDASQGEGVWSHVYEWFGGSVNGGGGDVVIHEFMEDETFVSQGWTASRRSLLLHDSAGHLAMGSERRLAI